jgi:MoaA/NifB/PqqE/SkfB family radical SAM enzyme
MLFKTLDGLKQVEGVKTIGFSGGEPFLYPDLLRKGVSYARELGFPVTIATNGFWGAWGDGEIVETLTELAPDHMSFSTDESHRIFVQDEVFGRAVSAAKALNIKCDICVGESRAGLSAGEYLKSMGDYKYLSRLSVHPVAPAGRARQYDEAYFFRYTPLEAARCFHAGEIAISYSGRVFPCCSPFVFDTALSLGSVHEDKIADILSNEEPRRMFLWLRTKGFGALIEAASERYGMRFNDPCAGGCEVCARLFADASLCEEFMALLREEYGRLMVDLLLDRQLA